MHAKQLFSSCVLNLMSSVFAFCFAPMASGQDTNRTEAIEQLRDSIVSARQFAKDAQAQFMIELGDSESESKSPIDEEIAVVEKRINNLAATIYHANMAVAAGRPKDQILSVMKSAATVKNAFLFSLETARKSDTLRMLNPYVGSQAKPESEEDSDVDSQFTIAMLDIASRLAGENLHKLELLEKKRQLLQFGLNPHIRLRSLLEEFNGLSQQIIETLETIRIQAPEPTEPCVAR